MRNKSLLGKRINAVYINPEKTVLAFHITDFNKPGSPDELVFYRTEGDCCSSSWIEHLAGLSAVSGGVVEEVIEVDMSHLNMHDHPEHDYLQVYSWKLKTTKGYCDIEFRNSSNGYYGGSLDEFDSVSTFDSIIEGNLTMKKLKEDF